MSKTLLALRHVPFEDLGHFRKPLETAGYDIAYSDVADGDLRRHNPLQHDILIVLGGPVGVYETESYPFLTQEIDFIKARLLANRPTLGVCLGAQLIAAALGASVFPSGCKEIGFSKLVITPEGERGPVRNLAGVEVLHWHGDTYSLPDGAVNLASTKTTEQQAFALGRNILGLQFHPEAETGSSFERWLVGHANELAAAKVNIPALRRQGLQHVSKLCAASTSLLVEWLSELQVS